MSLSTASADLKVGIMQPYWFPYIGYWQLIRAVDVFVIYDDIQYTKEGWINRNRFLRNGADALFSLSLKKDASSLDVRGREVAASFDRGKLLRQLEAAYHKAPYAAEVMPLLTDWIGYQEQNLFDYIAYSLRGICAHLELKTRLVVSSTLCVDRELKGKERVLALCERLGGRVYINPIGGQSLYDKAEFSARGVDLWFLKARHIEYVQWGGPFVPWLSIVDVLMFNSRAQVIAMLGEYDLV